MINLLRIFSKILIAFIPGLLITMISCSENEGNPDIKFENLSGYVQKGPFLIGTNIQISELDEKLRPTGKSYNTQTRDNSGFFEIESLELVSEFVELKADGYYFNEVSGTNSSSPITLYALTNLSDSARCNVNVLTHLERNRIRQLVGEELSFSESKDQAQQEIISFFYNEAKNDISAEYLDISKGGVDHAMLLAISVIMQGSRTESEFSELLATFSIDLEPDGLVEDNISQELVSQAIHLNYEDIRNNLEERYNELSIEGEIAEFENFIQKFLNESGEFIDPIASFAFSVNYLEVSFINYSQNASSYHWNFGDGNSSTEANPTHVYAMPGTYEVTLTATGEMSSTTLSKQVIINVDYQQLLSGEVSKTWYLLRDGIAIGLGPEFDNNEWWSFGVGGYTPAFDRPCILDDSFTFFRDGNWVCNTNGTIFVDAIPQGGWKEFDGCHEETETDIWVGLNGEDLSAFANGAVIHSYVFNSETNNITLNGMGAYIGMPVITSQGLNYLPENEKNYQVTKLVQGEIADLLTLALVEDSDAVWNFYFASYHDINDLPAIPAE